MIHGTTVGASAEALNAGFILNKMNSDQRVSYISGIIEGLAYSRYLRDKPDQSGMKCISAWYAKSDSMDNIWQWFARHPDKPAGALLYVLTKKECGA